MGERWRSVSVDQDDDDLDSSLLCSHVRIREIQHVCWALAVWSLALAVMLFMSSCDSRKIGNLNC